jgi:hypothetical protein
MSRDAVRRSCPSVLSSATANNSACEQLLLSRGQSRTDGSTPQSDALAKSRSLMRAELIDGAASTATSLKQAITHPDGSWLHEDTHATSVAIDHVDVESTPCSRGCDHLNRELLGKERS